MLTQDHSSLWLFLGEIDWGREMGIICGVGEKEKEEEEEEEVVGDGTSSQLCS